jgi:hypothetical protein
MARQTKKKVMLLMKKNNAYVLLFTLSIMTLITVITFQLMRNVFVGSHFDKTMIHREHAEMLALGGVNLAISQLTIKKDPKKDSTEESAEVKKTKQEKKLKEFLYKVLPHLNKWQVFELNEKHDGIDGEVKFCITSENGKININDAFDFKKKEFKPEYKKLLESLVINRKTPKGKVLKQLTDFFKKRKKKIYDVSQLQEAIPQLDSFFYEPPERTEKTKDARPNPQVTLQDLFTVWASKIEPLFLSDASCALFNLKRPIAYDAEKMKDRFKRVVDQFNPKITANLNDYWNMLQTIYTKKPLNIEEYKNIFSSKFEPKVYSVLSSGKVGDVEQKLLAIIEKQPEEAIKEKKNKKEEIVELKKEKEKNKKPLFLKHFKILKIYWL